MNIRYQTTVREIQTCRKPIPEIKKNNSNFLKLAYTGNNVKR